MIMVSNYLYYLNISIYALCQKIFQQDDLRFDKLLEWRTFWQQRVLFIEWIKGSSRLRLEPHLPMPLEICSLYSWLLCQFCCLLPRATFWVGFWWEVAATAVPSHSLAFLPHAQPANQQSINILLFATVFRPCWHPPHCLWQTLPGNKHNHGRVLRPLLPDHTQLDQAHLSVKGSSWSRSGRRWLTSV